MCGSDAVRVGIDRGDTLDELVATWADDQAELAQELRSGHLYP